MRNKQINIQKGHIGSGHFKENVRLLGCLLSPNMSHTQSIAVRPPGNLSLESDGDVDEPV